MCQSDGKRFKMKNNYLGIEFANTSMVEILVQPEFP